MSNDEAERMKKLVGKIIAVIEGEENYTYEEIMRVIDAIRKNYEDKGRDLLNKKEIKEVAMFGGLIG